MIQNKQESKLKEKQESILNIKQEWIIKKVQGGHACPMLLVIPVVQMVPLLKCGGPTAPGASSAPGGPSSSCDSSAPIAPGFPSTIISR